MSEMVSVIVPVLNRESLVVKTLDSIIGQTRLPDELIIVDNGSIDNTKQVVLEWIERNSKKGCHILFLEEKFPGACAARQRGLTVAKGDYVLFFDSDDRMNSGLISEAKVCAENHLDADIICWPVQIHLLNGKKRKPPFNPEKALENHLIHGLLRTHGYMIKKDFMTKSGAWTKQLPVWNDFELGLRLLLKNPKIIGINKPLVDVYSQAQSITGKNFSEKEGQWERSLEEMKKETKISSDCREKRISKIINYREVILAANYYKEGNKEGAEKLMRKALAESKCFYKILNRFVYFYTRQGGRGAWRIVGNFY